MLIIGYIVTTESKITIPRFKTISKLEEMDKPLPVLMVGYHTLKDKYNLDFLDRKIDDDIFWTFSRGEDRSEYNKDLYNFVIHCEQKMFDDFKYYHIDPINMKRKTLKKILSQIKNKTCLYTVDRDTLFIYTSGITMGFNLGLGDVMNIKRDKIFTKLMKYGVNKLPQDQINEIHKMMGDIDYDGAQLLFLSKKF